VGALQYNESAVKVTVTAGQSLEKTPGISVFPSAVA